jgi:sugar (pentulose or hexulose) kinase
MEGATLGLRYGLDVLMRLGITPSEIRLVGGGSKSELWRQMVSDVFGCPTICPVSSEAGAMGAALQAMWCYLGEKEGGASIALLTDRFVKTDESSRTDPNTANTSHYAAIYQNYLQLNDTLTPLFKSDNF